MQGNTGAAARKLPAREVSQNTRYDPGFIQARRVEKHLRDLLAEPAIIRTEREISAVIAKREGISEAEVDLIMARLVVYHSGRHHSLRCGLLNAMAMDDEAGRGAWEGAA